MSNGRKIRLQGQEALAERASKKLKNEELLITSMAGTRLHLEITQIPLWRAPGNHVGVKQLVDDFAKYLYLPRVKNAQVILDAIQDGVARLTWKQDTFAYADSYDAAASRYRGLEGRPSVTVQLNSESVVVKAGGCFGTDRERSCGPSLRPQNLVLAKQRVQVQPRL